MWLKVYFDEIAFKYGLCEDEIKGILRQTAEQFYTHKLRCPVLCEFTSEGLTLRKYQANGFGGKESVFSLRRADLRHMAKALQNAFQAQAIVAKQRYLKPFIGTAVHCFFLRYEQEVGVFYAEASEGIRIPAYCSLRSTPIHERNTYTPGQMLWFHVIGLSEKDREVCFILSRTTERLVDELFRLQGSTVMCVHRISGARSLVQAEKRIPKAHVIFAANELKERVIVRYGK
ncbi:hypothetical protein [Seleniivibrio woodruffii]|uniref:hypothetical protein n=1 Tax=Seleniivibrio woodruffii TaxID=1078050 RepID=UPI00240A10BE|nr:hypothetical protein [Seleniivibrio woodruffii]